MSQSSIDFTENGPVVPDTATVRDAVEQDWQAAFDNRLNPDPATPQGQLITSRNGEGTVMDLAGGSVVSTAGGVFMAIKVAG